MAGIYKTGVISSTGFPKPNLYLATSLSSEDRERSLFLRNTSTDWTSIIRYYNAESSNHTFTDDTDTILLDQYDNIGIAFQRKATDINLDSDSYYTISCEAKCTKSGARFSIGLSYYTTSNTWVWRSGENKVDFDAVNTWQKFTLKFKPDADTQYIMYCFTVNPGVAGGTDTFSIRHCKLEKGEIATEWVPNVDDISFPSSPGFLEIDDNVKIQKAGYIQASEFIEF